MEYTSNQRAAIFLVARWTHKLKNKLKTTCLLVCT